MRVVLKVFGVPQEKQVEWTLTESKRNGVLDLATGFWNRQSQRRPNADLRPVKRFRAPRSGDTDEDPHSWAGTLREGSNAPSRAVA